MAEHTLSLGGSFFSFLPKFTSDESSAFISTCVFSLDEGCSILAVLDGSGFGSAAALLSLMQSRSFPLGSISEVEDVEDDICRNVSKKLDRKTYLL
jgi:serine phosphatase RsbU (regulator of sigma subunit)